MSKALIGALLKGVWMIEPGYADAHLPYIHSFLSGKLINVDADSKEAKSRPYILENPTDLSEDDIEEIDDFEDEEEDDCEDDDETTFEGSIAVVPVCGPIMKEDNCGDLGSESLAAQVLAYGNDANIGAIILKIDSPGGQVYGTQTLVDAIAQVAKTKNVIGFINDGMAASAAYWIASACTNILASQKTDSIGSIGVFVKLADYDKKLEADGLKIHTIYADQSSEKNKDVNDALAGNYATIKAELLNPIADAFISSVKTSRADKLNLSAGDPFKGKIYMADDALKIGLIDQIGNFNAAIKAAIAPRLGAKPNASSNLSVRAESRTDKNKPQANSQNMKKIQISAIFASLLGFFNAKPEAGAEHAEVDWTMAKQQELNEKLSKLDALEKANATLSTSETALKAVAAKYEATVMVLNPDATAEDIASFDMAAAVTKLKNGAAAADPSLKGAEEKKIFTSEEEALLDAKVEGRIS